MPRKRFVHFNSATKAADHQVSDRIPHENRSMSRPGFGEGLSGILCKWFGVMPQLEAVVWR